MPVTVLGVEVELVLAPVIIFESIYFFLENGDLLVFLSYFSMLFCCSEGTTCSFALSLLEFTNGLTAFYVTELLLDPLKTLLIILLSLLPIFSILFLELLVVFVYFYLILKNEVKGLYI